MAGQLAKSIPLGGGLDLVTPAMMVREGRAIAALNYEPEVRGYSRLDGYERLDGRPKPSESTYWTLPFDQGDAAIAVGAVITGGTHASTARILAAAVVQSGAYVDGDAAGYLVLELVSGEFEDGEAIIVSGSPVAFAASDAIEEGADTDENNTLWRVAAEEAARARIQAVPGSGAIRGVTSYRGSVYAWRDNVGATACILHKATAAGWTAVVMPWTIDFTGQTTAFVEGEVINGQTSGAQGVVRRIVVMDGDHTTSDGEGYIVVDTVVGTWASAENIRQGTTVRAVAASAAVRVAFPAGGRYDFKRHNFYGQAASLRLYGTNGVGRAFEFDGTTVVPIRTGLSEALDKPLWVAEIKNHLLLAFAGGSLLHSGIGEPLAFQAVLGAGEIAFGEEVTGLIDSAATAVVVLGRNKIGTLSGTSAADFTLSVQTDDSGAVAWTAQMIGQPTFLDDLGVRKMEASDAFGDWRMGSLTGNVQPIFSRYRKAKVAAVGSMRVRGKDQYRLFFADGSVICIYVGRSAPEVMTLDYGQAFSCFHSGENASGDEILLVGNAEGFVYELDAGTSFDGEPVPAYLRLSFVKATGPSQNVRWHKATLELDASAATRIGLTAEFSYADPDTPAASEQSFLVRGGGGFWNEAFWNELFWSSPAQGVAEAYIDGIGQNVSITIISEAANEEPHVLSVLTLNFSPRGLRR